MFKQKLSLPETISITILIVLIILSTTIGSSTLSSPQFHSDTIRTLDAQKNEALALSVTVTAASTGLSMMPDDVGTPIAHELANLSMPLFLIVAIIYLEIFLLTTFGWITGSFLFPTACALMIAFVLFRREYLLIWVKKIMVLSIALVLLIPTSAAITNHIENTFSETVNQKLHAASHIADASQNNTESDENAIVSFFSSLADNVSSAATAARDILSTMVDAVAVLVITSCIIPVLTLLLFLKAVQIALNVNIPTKYLALLVPPTKKDRQQLQKAKAADEALALLEDNEVQE